MATPWIRRSIVGATSALIVGAVFANVLPRSEVAATPVRARPLLAGGIHMINHVIVVLQDHLFEGVRSWSLPSHLDMVSGWSARCSDPHDPMTCSTYIGYRPGAIARAGPRSIVRKRPYAWTDLTYLLHRAHVSWRYFVANGSQPDCVDGQMVCRRRPQSASTPGIWNPLPGFRTVWQDH